MKKTNKLQKIYLRWIFSAKPKGGGWVGYTSLRDALNDSPSGEPIFEGQVKQIGIAEIKLKPKK